MFPRRIEDFIEEGRYFGGFPVGERKTYPGMPRAEDYVTPEGKTDFARLVDAMDKFYSENFMLVRDHVGTRYIFRPKSA